MKTIEERIAEVETSMGQVIDELENRLSWCDANGKDLRADVKCWSMVNALTMLKCIRENGDIKRAEYFLRQGDADAEQFFNEFEMLLKYCKEEVVPKDATFVSHVAFSKKTEPSCHLLAILEDRYEKLSDIKRGRPSCSGSAVLTYQWQDYSPIGSPLGSSEPVQVYNSCGKRIMG